MIKQATLLMSLLLLSGIAQALECTLEGASVLQWNTQWAIGQNVYDAIDADSSVGTAIYAARDAWDDTYAAGYIGDWNENTFESDCPYGQARMIGAYPFTEDCETTNGLGSTIVAVYDDDTGSIAVNLSLAWSTSPGSGEYDIQSVMTHEFGHMLGLGHLINGTCWPINYGGGYSCAQWSGHETMGPYFDPADPPEYETCPRTLEDNDKAIANDFYF